MNYWTQSKNNIFVAAHRGIRASYPENTIQAFKAAIDAGVDQIETDIRCSKDGVLVLIHDKTVDRTTNSTGLVSEKTLSELSQLDAGSYKGDEFAGCKIPTLRELMELVKYHPTITLDIELKVYPTQGDEQRAYEVCDKTLDMIEEYGFRERVVLNTFSAKLHEYIHTKYQNIYKQHVYFPLSCHKDSSSIDPYSYAYCCCMFSENDTDIMATKEAFNKMDALGVQPWAGASVKDEAGAQTAIDRGAYLITCDNADLILEILRKKGYHK